MDNDYTPIPEPDEDALYTLLDGEDQRRAWITQRIHGLTEAQIASFLNWTYPHAIFEANNDDLLKLLRALRIGHQANPASRGDFAQLHNDILAWIDPAKEFSE